MRLSPIQYVIFACALLLLSYSAFRASSLSFTHDESLSYLAYSSSGFVDILTFEKVDANHHFLNTILMYLAWQSVGLDEFSLRLPNLIAHLFYLIFSFGIVRKLSHFPLIFCGFLSLNLNPFVLDFFSLARGYGLGLCFMMGSLYFLFEANDRSPKAHIYQIISSGMSLLAVLSNLVFLNFYCASLLFILVISIIKNRRHYPRAHSSWMLILKHHLYLGINLLILATILTPIVKKLLAKKAFSHGGEKGFWADTIESLIQVSLYGQSYPLNTFFLLQVFVIFIMLLALIVLGYFFVKKKWEDWNWCLFVVISLTSLCVLSTIAQHFLFQTKYLVDRTGIFFIPLFGLILIFTLSGGISISQRYSKISYSFFIVITLLISWHFSKTINFTHVLLWKNDADTKTMIDTLVADYQKNQGKQTPIKLRASEYYQPTIDFYRKSRQLHWLKSGLHLAKLIKKEPWEHFDYFYVQPSIKKRLEEDKNVIAIQQFETTQNFLLRKKNVSQVIVLYEEAHQMLHRGLLSQAIQQYNQILSISPEHAPSHHDLGLVFKKLGDDLNAGKHWKYAIERDPTYTSAYLHLASLALTHQKPETAFNLLKKTIRFSDAPEVYKSLGDLYFYSAKAQGSSPTATKEFLEAVKFYRKAAEGGSSSGQKRLGRMYEFGYGVKKDEKEAFKWYQKASQHETD